MSDQIVFSSDLSFSSDCSFCQQEIKPSQPRRTTVLLSTSNKEQVHLANITMIHLDPCLKESEQKHQQNLLRQIEFPPWISVKTFEQVEQTFPLVAKLSKAYPIANVKVSLYGYRLEFPMQSKSQAIEQSLMPFKHFQAFFASVFVYTLRLSGLRIHDYLPALLKRFAQLELNVSCFAWIHQVSGSNDKFRVVMLMMPEEAHLKPLYKSGVFKTWLDTQDNKLPAVAKLVDIAKTNLAGIQNCLSDTAQKLGLEIERTATAQGLAQTTSFGGRNQLRTDYNVQLSSDKEVYILPHPDIYKEEKTTPLLLCSFTTDDLLVPVVYDTSVRDLEKEYNHKTMKKIELTNRHCLLARYPRAIIVKQ